jgi:thiamine pyrophosphokinase
VSKGTALIVGAAPETGADSFYGRIIAAAEFVIAADGGLLVCEQARRVPDVCVGDFDSAPADAVERAAAAGAEVIPFPAQKDVSDLDLSLVVARERGFDRVVFTAAFAGRIDHALVAFGTALRAADLLAECHERRWRAFVLDARHRAELVLHETPGSTISIIALAGTATVTASGFVYPLEMTDLSPLSSHALSNVAADGSQLVRVHAGAALVIANCEDR